MEPPPHEAREGRTNPVRAPVIDDPYRAPPVMLSLSLEEKQIRVKGSEAGRLPRDLPSPVRGNTKAAARDRGQIQPFAPESCRTETNPPAPLPKTRKDGRIRGYLKDPDIGGVVCGGRSNRSPRAKFPVTG